MGAYQVGMLRALLEREVLPGVVVGTSVGALDGAAVAADPYQVPVEHEAQVDWLFAWWGRVDEWIRSRRPSLRL